MKILCALKDRATEAFTPVMTLHTQQEAIRSLRQTLKDKNTPVAQTPSDFELWRLGTYDDQTGEIKGNMEMIARCEDHME